jgi:2-polyprenyl-3-methyl-5-hydroxy-6-metoxy-1,4-benzoquinol methylase
MLGLRDSLTAIDVNLNNYDSRNRLLLEWLLEHAPEGAKALDVGASDGTFCPEVEVLRSRGLYLAGVDPDEQKLARNPWLREKWTGTLETAQIPDASFDVIFALYVVEHVQTPDRFLQAASRILKPGGSFFFITPNGRHYFVTLARLAHKLQLQERLLRRLRPRELVDEYHHHAYYRLNSPGGISKLATRHGFAAAEMRFSENLGEIDCYFPKALRGIPRLWQSFAAATRREDLLLNLMVRLVRAA